MLFAAFTLASCIALSNTIAATERRCTSSDLRDIYPGCDLMSHSMTLWCDRTNLTAIPNPDDIKAYAPCYLASVLYINNSCLRDIEQAQIRRYTRLKKIDCSDNFLTRLKNDTFAGAHTLEYIDVSENKIAEIEEAFFRGLDNLRHLRMKRNAIARLSIETFKYTPNLKEVYLDHNKLDEIQVEVFSALRKLQIMSLQYNKIYKWFPSSNASFPELLELDLGNNELQCLEEKNFDTMPALQRLILQNNHIAKVESSTFISNRELVYIDLRRNLLQTLPRRLFTKQCKLKVLRLNGNQLQTPHVEWFMNVVQHSSVEDHSTASFVSHNDWKCDCRSAEYWELLKYLSKGDKTSQYNKLNLRCGNYSDLGSITLDSCIESSHQDIELLLNSSRGICNPRHLLPKSFSPDIQVSHVTYTITMVLIGVFATVGLIGTVLFLIVWYKRRTEKKQTQTKFAKTNREDSMEKKPLSKNTLEV